MIGSLVVTLAALSSLPLDARPPPEKGMALGLFSMDPHFSYDGLLEEIVAIGTTHVIIVWVQWQDDVTAVEIRPLSTWTATDRQISDTIARARGLGLHVTSFPIVRLVSSRTGEWRGRIAPSDEDKWWRSYEAFIVHGARISARAGASRLSIGSELLSREPMRSRWLKLIASVRRVAPDLELLYSANWDHYRKVSFWDAVDVVGLTGYWELTRNLDPTVEELAFTWVGVRRQVLTWIGELKRPFIFSEIGYPSLDGGASWPWDETRKAPVDHEEQRRAYEAFVRAWGGTPELKGVYWWNWFGFGGSEDTNYTPRRKPAAAVVSRWYRGR